MLLLRNKLPKIRTDTRPLNLCVTERRDTQGFRSDPISDELLNELLTLTMLAPSGFNLQPWRFIVVREQENKVRLRKAAFNQLKVEEAPVVIIACANPEGWKQDIDKVISIALECGQIMNEELARSMKKTAFEFLESVDTRIWATKQTMIAFTQMMLLAETYGLDTAPLEGFDEEKIKDAFSIPEHFIVLALLCLGYKSIRDYPFGGRFELGEVVSYERFSEPL